MEQIRNSNFRLSREIFDYYLEIKHNIVVRKRGKPIYTLPYNVDNLTTSIKWYIEDELKGKN